jgi:putative ABC transport system permease protein
MTLLGMAWRYLWARPLVTALTLAGVMLGAALVSATLAIRRETERAFLQQGASIDLVVGAKGSPLQLTLSAVYHLDVPTGNIDWKMLETVRADRDVAAAWPVGLGDNYRGFRIVGTEPSFLGMVRRDLDTGEPRPAATLAEGRNFAAPFEVVLGADVAHRTGMRPGDTFVGTHGLMAVAGAEEHREFPYTVVGILAPSSGFFDRAIFTPMESVWQVHEAEAKLHEKMYAVEEEEPAADGEPLPDTPAMAFFAQGGFAAREKPRETTAILVQLKSPAARWWVADRIRAETDAMAAIPLMEMQRLYLDVLAPIQRALLAVAALVVVVAALSIIATLYQAAERRRRELALLRTLGASPREVFLLVLLEAGIVALLGVSGGWVLGHACVAGAGVWLASHAGIDITAFRPDRAELIALGAIAATGLVSGLIPAAVAYRQAPAADLALV